MPRSAQPVHPCRSSPRAHLAAGAALALSALVAAAPASADVFRVTDGGGLVPETPYGGPAPLPRPIGRDRISPRAAPAAPAQPRMASPPLRPAPPQIRAHLAAAANRYGLSESLLTAVAYTESRFRPDARSPAGAHGVMQLMPATARDLGVTDTADPSANVMGGARYLRMMLDRFGNNLELALAGYNAGPAAVQRFGGIPPFRETRSYVRQVISRLADEADAEAR